MKSASLDKGFQNKKLKIIMISNNAEVLCTLQAITNFYFEKCLSDGCSEPTGEQVQTCTHKKLQRKRKSSMTSHNIN